MINVFDTSFVLWLLSFIMAALQNGGVNALASSSKRVLVTGANKGIGKAICQELLESYPEVYVFMGSRDAQRGEKAVSEILSAVPDANDRIECVPLDVSNSDSVKAAAKQICGADSDQQLYGIVNNAGIGWGAGFEATLETNYFGPRRVCDAFGPALIRPGGRIVNIASASGPDFVSHLRDSKLKAELSEPLSSSVDELDQLAESYFPMMDYQNDAYGLSKALVNAYTVLLAKENPDLVINSCTPGWVQTDMTAGQGASSTPKQGASCPIHLLLSSDMESIPSGRYYGSDKVRSPLDRYRGPGEPPYDP